MLAWIKMMKYIYEYVGIDAYDMWGYNF